ncbi:MAG: RHS repeat protein, partial [Clostridia bacterium]|nr:RHS repeat protein [Clostridia bacterium]
EGTYELMSLKIILLVNANDTVEAQVIPITSEDTGGGDGGSGETEIFPVNFTVDSTNMTATCGVPFNDINSAVEDGKFVYGTFTYMGFPVRIPFVCIASDNQAFALFEGTYELMSLKIILLVNANDTVEAQVIPITSDDTEDSDVPPTSVDLSALDTTGEIVETYADGTVKTTTIEYDDDGNPVKITDGDGNVTVLVW